MQIGKYNFDLDNDPIIMGILNVVSGTTWTQL